MEGSRICGIAGFHGDGDKNLLEKMCNVMNHRGPDDRGLFVNGEVGLGNNRLSIIDLETGHQPMKNEDGTIHITYNGEIYNFKELRSRLEAEGHRFESKSDTEVIIHGYEEHGEHFLQQLNGMFAFALWDSRKKTLLLARDRIGIKPLHYTVADHALYFGSEIKAILETGIPREVNCDGVHQLINLGYIPGDSTLFRGVFKLPPAHFLKYHDGQTLVEPYWGIPLVSQETEDDVLVDQIRSALDRSIQAQLVADVPVGSFLSGGLDTSTIVAHASKKLGSQLKTFCMGFGEETDELRDARVVADYFGTDHYELVLESSKGMRLYPKMIWHMDQPKMNLYSWFICEFARKHVKVCLSGLGGDELFLGYFNRYRHALRVERLRRFPLQQIVEAVGHLLYPIASRSNNLKIRNRIRMLRAISDPAELFLILAGSLDQKDTLELTKFNPSTADLLKSSCTQFFSKTGDFLDQFTYAELKTKLPDDFLAVDDAMSMAHSLEVRVPLLDNGLVEIMSRVPWQLSFRPGSYGKLLLRKAVAKMLPKHCLQKPKWGFSVDVFSWFKGELGEYARQIIPESDAISKFFNREFIEKILSKRPGRSHTRYYSLIWHLVGFHIWHRMYIDSKKKTVPSFEIDSFY